MKKFLFSAVAATALLSACGGGDVKVTGNYEPTLKSLDTHPVPTWWQDAKFGLIIHWGTYSVPAYAPVKAAAEFVPPPECSPLTEWYWFFQTVFLPKEEFPYFQTERCGAFEHHRKTYGENFHYDDFAAQWKAERYDPQGWVRMMHDAGARYFVFITKHHDGVALWPTQTTDRSTMHMGPKRDLVGPLMAAARDFNKTVPASQQVRPGLYYSIPEWYSPAPRPDNVYSNNGEILGGMLAPMVFGAKPQPPVNAYTGESIPYTGYKPIKDYAADQVRPQMRELIDSYHPDVLWCDIGGQEGYFKSNETIAYYYNQAEFFNPDGVVVNDRCGTKRDTHRDFVVEEYAEKITQQPPLELTRGMSDSFSYNAAATDADFESARVLIQTLAETVAHGGNFLLGVGPKADGSFPPEQTKRLAAIGAWLRVNGQAIYGSRRWTQLSDNTGNFFVKGQDGALYVLATQWSGQGQIEVQADLPLAQGEDVTQLGAGTVRYEHQNGRLVLHPQAQLPTAGEQYVDTVVFRLGKV